MVWWTSPAKEILNVLFNRILAPYVENLDMNQVNYGIGQGQLTLRKLRLKKGALDKFRLPVDVIEGHLGTFTLSLHWMNLGNEPVEVLVEDVYLLVVPSPTSNANPEEEEQRAQAAKAERVNNAELLHMRGQPEQTQDESPQSQGLIASLMGKILNNLQIKVKNVHIRYEDKLSVPGHPFSAGITLAGFSAASVNEKWEPAFIESTAGKIHKLGNLESLALYFNTDSESISGLPYEKSVQRFKDLIAREGSIPDHQFIMKPVTGQGKIVMNSKLDKNTPRFDVQLFFDEIGVAIDDNQYRDAISLVDMFHFYARQHQYRKHRASIQEMDTNRPRALFQFAQRAILDDIHERNRRWTWEYFAERRDDRKLYVDLFMKKLLNQLLGNDLKLFEALEKKLSYEDIRFYRSIARSQLRKDLASRKRVEEEKKKEQAEAAARGGWSAWLWGSSPQAQTSTAAPADPTFGGPMTDEQRKQLYDVLDFDEKSAVAESLNASRDALKARVVAKLNKGSFALRTDPHGKAREIISVVFDVFQADVLQRPDNLEAAISLGGFGVFDGTTVNTLHPQIVHVKESDGSIVVNEADPFFFLKFEKNPLDERADTALTVRLRHMEIIYHRGYVEAIYHFFKPPASQLESVEALLDVASQTLEGIRRDTRAGLEYALQTHKTIDIQMDMNAPVIIIPEDITTNNCKHLLIDAGHISIESNLADKDAINAVHAKRNQKYTDADYTRLEALMYDKFSLKLEAAQFLLGNDLDSCRKALTSTERDALHLVERINMDFEVQNSIVPTAYTLARFKIAGNLPSLHVNFSDTKYKALMRLLDVAIPKFDDSPAEDAPLPVIPRPGPPRHVSGALPLSTGAFWDQNVEYNVDTDEEDEASDKDSGEDQFFDVDTGGTGRAALHQHIFELAFSVDNLRVALAKAEGAGENPLGEVVFQRFSLNFSMAKYDMNVDVHLRSLSMFVNQLDKPPLEFMSSAESEVTQDKDLLIVKYVRVQQESPEFQSEHEGIDQNVDIAISTFIFHAAPEAVLMIYNFVMTTFVPQSPPSTPSLPAIAPSGEVALLQDQTVDGVQESKIRVLVKLASVKVVLVNEDVQLATLALSTADVSVFLRSSTMRVTGRLGSLALHDDSPLQAAVPEFKEILSIEGENFADFVYQTFDRGDKSDDPGINSQVTFKAASVKVHFVEQALHGIYLFVVKLARLKGLYDAATQVAVQSVSDIQRMQIDVSIKSPILVFPTNAGSSADVLTMRLGEMSAKNQYDGPSNKTTASLRGIQLASTLACNGQSSILKIIEDIDITADVVQSSEVIADRNNDYPASQVSIRISDVKLYLTQVQYGLLIALSRSIPEILVGAPEGNTQAEEFALHHGSTRDVTPANEPASRQQTPLDLQPELRRSVSDGKTPPSTSLDLVLTMEAVKLHLYDEEAATELDRKEHGIARFALNSTTLRYKSLSNGASEAQVVLKSFTMSNTRPGRSKFREIIPAAQHDRNQFMVLYTSGGGSESAALAIVTIDSPQIIFAVDPIFALAEFFTSAFTAATVTTEQEGSPTENLTQAQSAGLDFRVDLYDLSVNVLEDDEKADTRAIALSIKQILLSQQGILALTVERLGMSLMQVGQAAERVRFLDDVDLTFTLDNRASSAQQQLTNIEVSCKPIVFRASYRDINLITAIVNRAIALAGQSSFAGSAPPTAEDAKAKSIATFQRRPSSQPSSRALAKGSKSLVPSGRAQVLMAKEQLKASFDGFRLVLIADIHEQPVLHLRVKPFSVTAKDWTGELHASATLAVQLNYWNMTNSHWEPLFDPWTFTMAVDKDTALSGMTASLSARERIDLNIGMTFIELALTSLNTWTAQGEAILSKARGSYAPYRIVNRTGSAIHVWSDIDGSQEAKDAAAVKIDNGQSTEWRFDDWKTMREHMSSSGSNHIGVQFVEKAWDRLRSIPVDKEGEYVFSLRPRTEKYTDRLLCEVSVQDNVKVVTLRSTYKVENQTLYPLELMLIDDVGHPVQAIEKIAPGRDYSLPIESVVRHRVRVQPDQGFGYKWSPAIRWEDLIAKKTFTVKCNHTDEREAAFRFHAHVETDLNDPVAKKYPRMSLRLRAPLELENLLPFNLEYRIYDKNTDQNWRSYLRKGGIMPVHSVELGHLVLLNVNLQDSAFKPSEFAIINADAHADFDVEKRLTIRDQKDRKMEIRLNYVRYPDSGGAFKVQVYTPYLLINKTGLPFSVRARSSRASQPQDIAGETRSDVLSKETPYIMSCSGDRGHEFTIKVGESNWSKLVSFDAPSAETGLVMASQSQKPEEIHVGLSWAEGLGKYKLTKVVTLSPRFLVKNNLPQPICFREHGSVPRGRSTLDSGERRALDFMRNTPDKLLTIAFPGLNAQWSAPINMEDIGSVHFRLRNLAKPDDIQLVRADVQIDGSSIFVYFFPASDDWPFSVENDSDYALSLCQTDARLATAESPLKPNPSYSVSPHSSTFYAWDFPAEREKKIQLTINGARRIVDIMEIGDLVPFKFPGQDGNRIVSIDVRAEGQRQVLRITNYVADQSLYRPKRRSTGSLARVDTMASSQEAFEAVTEDVTPTFAVKINLLGIGISLINRKLLEVVYLSLTELKCEYTSSPVAQAVTVACGSIQVDNQLHDAIFPVVLQPTPIGKEAGGVAALPTVQASFIWLNDDEHGVFFIKYCSVLLQALTIEADEDFLFSVYELAQLKGASWDSAQEDVLIQNPEGVPEPQATTIGRDLYFEVLELQPIRLSLSFMRTERVSGETRLSTRNPLAVVVNALTMTLGNVNDAPLGMNALAIKDMRLTTTELENRIMYHYRQEVLRQVYRILGSADFFGNPVGLFTNVSSGVADIFYEPYNGVVHGNQDLGVGIAKGAASFVKKTVFGVTDSMTKFTSSVGKGLSAATMDSEYQLRRRMNQRRNKPRHAIYGVTAGAEAFATSVASGMEGILMKPLEGAESGGAAGFFKGVGKGLVGAFTKPAVGMFDLAANVTEGIRNTTTVFDNPARDRVRLPRHVPADGVLQPYSEREALGQFWMKDLEQGQFRDELYVAHINLPEGDTVVLLTASRILTFSSKRLRLDWQLPFTSIQGVTVEDTGIRFTHKAGKENDRFIYIPDKGSQSWFFGQVATVVKAFNVRRRMDSV